MSYIFSQFVFSYKKTVEIIFWKVLYISFLMYILLIVLFNPFQKNIKLNDNPTESRHLQIAIFALGIIELINFYYSLILKAPQEFLSSL